LAGLPWALLPYVPSGLPLAREVQGALVDSPDAAVFVLANHGLVVCGDSCEATESLLREVEARLAITPRSSPAPDFAVLAELTRGSEWQLPLDSAVHALATDPLARLVASQGVLYPCQAIFLSPKTTLHSPSEVFAMPGGWSAETPFLVVAYAGVVVNRQMTVTARATLSGLAQVLLRIDGSSSIRYMDKDEVDGVLNLDTYRYREMVEGNGARGLRVV
jgi:hypothetical protein